ncbi:MAG: hypothetical protein K2W85_12315 [Phycisphaerales bacterium]|nr:hypothetical protein [Phycisphaerales bacterium]
MGQSAQKQRRYAEVAWVALIALAVVGIAFGTQPLQSRKVNFFNAGTQPLQLTAPLIDPLQCSFCHGGYDDENEPYYKWTHSMMAQSGRDPIFYAALAIAEQDASYVGEACLRCHTPSTWVRGRVKFDNDDQSPEFGKTLPLTDADQLGVSCSICHRMVDPVYQPGVSPGADAAILSGLTTGVPLNPHNANFILDPEDRRRGPFDLDSDWQAAGLGPFPGFHDWFQSPFHTSSRMCATCHEVSTPHFKWDPQDNRYALIGQTEQPQSDKYNQFPEQRTFSEWGTSLFAIGPVNLNGRFGNRTSVSSCQDCHMPKATGQGCALEPPTRTNLPRHEFAGANSWVLRAINFLYPQTVTGMNDMGVDESIARNVAMLQAASDLQLNRSGATLTARIINFSGHKLPTGYTEGRRMWINVQFKNAAGQVIAERGAYDFATAVLTENDTKVYEAKLGPDAQLAAQVGTAAAPTFRLAISNKIYKDNRIPPMGFNNAAATAVQAGHVPPGQYADGQYWDDTPFAIPAGARSATVRVYHQTTTKEYIEFLRDNNTDPNPMTNEGQIAYNMWAQFGKSTPVVLDEQSITLACPCDWNANGQIDVPDIFQFLNDWFASNADFNGDGSSTVSDIFDFLNCWFANCA